MKYIDLHWSHNKGEGCVKYSKIFEESHIVVKLDLLQDCIYDLEEKYNSLLAKPASKEETHE
jgi:hypothetical protein